MQSCYENRELSWLKFNERVLEEACNKNVPLCERLSFAAIFCSNLDEFYMVRVGSLFDRMLVSKKEAFENKTGLSYEKQLSAIFKRTLELYPVRDAAYENIMSELSHSYNVIQVNFRQLTKSEENFLQGYFIKEIMPLISPQVIDKRHPFPFLKNKEIYAVAALESKSSMKIGIIPASGAFARVIYLPTENCIRFMLVEELILHYLPLVFENYKISSKSLMRITRNADIEMEEALYDQEVDLRDVMSELLVKRKKLSPVRAEFSRKFAEEPTNYLCEKLGISQSQIFRLKSPLDLSFLFKLRAKLETQYQNLFFERAVPQLSSSINPNEKMMKQIAKKDILLSYPFESIKPFLKLLYEASVDPDVVSMKITLYRVANESKVIEALVNAAENGKEVLVLVELRARFDEENNIDCSKRLEQAGCNVIYGPEGYKVHSKLCLITKKTGEKLEYYTQIGTGNYNEKTSALYTDLSLMTANKQIAEEALAVFNAVSLGNFIENTNYLLVAPLCLQNKILALIDIEIRKSQSGEEGYIGLKLNSLTDKVIIDKLIYASQMGVKIQLVIRGICCLVAGVQGYTENISVRSIVGRYLEHSRIYIFGRGEGVKVYISSADFMTRNTLRRIEVAAPILDSEIRSRILQMFNVLLCDNVKARIMKNDGNYKTTEIFTGDKLSSQDYFINEAYENAKLAKSASSTKKNFVEKFFHLFKKK